MAHLHSAHPRTSLSKQLVNFTNSSAGLEKTLRLIQALAQIAAEVCIDNATAMRYLMAKSQLALSRRYFRYFSFIGCFERVYDLLAGDSPSGGTMLTMIELAKSSCLGMYFLLEDLTILHAMNIWLVSWNTPVLIEANKFWFYALCVSITGAVWELLFGSAAQSKTQKGHPDIDQKKEESEKPSSSKPVPSTIPLLKRIVVDGCDLTLPGSFLGWIALGDLGVGMAMVVSTVVASRDIWARAQR